MDPAKPLPRDTLHWHLPHYHHSTPASAIRRGNWKLIEFFEDGAVELYDLSQDSAETKNVADQQPQIARELRSNLAAWRKGVGAQLPLPNPSYDPARASELAKGRSRLNNP